MSDTLIWAPNAGPQYRFVSSPEREVLYGGAAGGGKSDGMLMSAATDRDNKHHRGIIFRRSFPELRDLIRRSKELYPYFNARYRSSSHEWIFKSGAIVEFGFLDKDKDKDKYTGRAFNFMGFEELTQWPGDQEAGDGTYVNSSYQHLLTRLRSPMGSGLRLRVRATTNPGNVGHNWVRARFQIRDDGSPSEIYDHRTKQWRVFIPSRISDNPFLAGTSYELDLDALPEHLRKMWKEGRWDVIAGAMFTTFDPRPGHHVCDAFPIPHEWKIWRGADDGFNKPACVLWFTQSKEGHVFIINELYRAGMTPEVMAQETLKRDKELERQNGREVILNNESLAGCIDPGAFTDVGMGNARGPGRGQVMNALGCRFDPAVKGPGSRVAGVNLIHSALQPMRDGKPKLMIFRRCHNLIRTLPTLPKDKTNPEDVDTEAEDHCFIAGTMIRTQAGEKAIETVKPGELVFTRRGLFPVYLCGETGESDTLELTLGDGSKLSATGNHLVFSNGWKRFDSMTLSDTVSLWNQQSFLKHANNTEGLDTIFADVISSAMEAGYTGRFSETISELFQKDSTFTTKTTTHPITEAIISNCYQNLITESCMEKPSLINSERRGLRMSLTLFKEMLSSQRSNAPWLQKQVGKKPYQQLFDAFVVEMILKLYSLHEPRHAAELVNLPCSDVVEVRPNGRRKVFNLSVLGCPEFFANGILVHNCYDAMRYGLTYQPRTMSQTKVTGV